MAILLYLAAIVSANLAVSYGGAENAWWIMPICAFLFIGLDLALRDSLHERWSGNGLMLKMGGLILAGAGLTFAIQPDAGAIAVASSVAFGLSGAADAGVYHLLRDRSFLTKSNGSNVAGALADSLTFPTLAFGVIMPVATLTQFVAKAFGGAVWSVIIRHFRGTYTTVTAAALLFFAQPAEAQRVSAHYDVARQTYIGSFNYAQPVIPNRTGGRLFVNGFVEVWRNPKEAFPRETTVLFSKHWVSYRIAGPLSLSAEIEVSRNMAGAYARFPRDIPFKENTWFVQPKMGVSLNLKKLLK